MLFSLCESFHRVVAAQCAPLGSFCASPDEFCNERGKKARNLGPTQGSHTLRPSKPSLRAPTFSGFGPSCLWKPHPPTLLAPQPFWVWPSPFVHFSFFFLFLFLFSGFFLFDFVNFLLGEISHQLSTMTRHYTIQIQYTVSCSPSVLIKCGICRYHQTLTRTP